MSFHLCSDAIKWLYNFKTLGTVLTDELLKAFSDTVTDAHTRIQADYELIDPVVGVSRNMRKNGVPADAMTIDCLKTKKRIIIILHDHQPDLIHYQFSFTEQDPGDKFESMPFADVTDEVLYTWMKDYFS